MLCVELMIVLCYYNNVISNARLFCLMAQAHRNTPKVCVYFTTNTEQKNLLYENLFSLLFSPVFFLLLLFFILVGFGSLIYIYISECINSLSQCEKLKKRTTNTNILISLVRNREKKRKKRNKRRELMRKVQK